MVKKIYHFIIKAFLALKYLFVSIRLVLIKSRIKKAKNNWYLSKNRNFYNPTLKATVYKYSDYWKIARYGNYFGEFEGKEKAKSSIFEIWIEEQQLTRLVSRLSDELKNIRRKISNSYKEDADLNKKESLSYTKQVILSEKETTDENVNFRAGYFYLTQTQRKCYRCNKDITVNAIILPKGFEEIDDCALENLEQIGRTQGNIPFRHQDYISILSYLTYISPRALEQIYNCTNDSLFQRQDSAIAGCSYYRSICNYCGSAQGDHFVISEYNSPFQTINSDDLKKIKFYKIDHEIQVCAGGNSIGYGNNQEIRIVTNNI